MLRELLAKFGIEVDDKGLKKADKATADITSALSGLAGALGGAALIGGAIAFTQSLIDMGSELDDASNRLGIGADELQAWRFAAGQGGASAEELGSGLKILTKNLADASDGGAAAQEFTKLGIKVKNAAGESREATEVIGELADKIKDGKTETDRAGIALKFFGKGGLALLPMLKDGSEGVDALMKRFKELGGGLSKEFVKAADEAGDAQAELKVATLSLKSSIGVVLLPVVTTMVQKITDFVVGIRKATHNSNVFRVLLGAVGAGAVVTGIKLTAGLATKFGLVQSAAGGASGGILGTVSAFGKLIKAGVGVGLKIAILFLILEDLYTLFTGGHSAIGAFIDGIFGVGASAEFVKQCKAAFFELVEIIKAAGPTIQFLAKQTALFLKDMFHGFKGYGTMFSEFFEFLGKDISKFWEDVKSWADKGLKGLAGAIQKFQADHPIIMGIANLATGGTVGALAGAGTVASVAAGGAPVSQNNETTIRVTAPDAASAGRQVANAQAGVNNDNAAALAAVARP